MFEVTRIARDEVIGLALGSGDHLNGILKIAPAECQCLLQNQIIDRFDAEQRGEVAQNSGGLLLPQMFDQQVMQGGDTVCKYKPALQNVAQAEIKESDQVFNRCRLARMTRSNTRI